MVRYAGGQSQILTNAESPPSSSIEGASSSIEREMVVRAVRLLATATVVLVLAMAGCSRPSDVPDDPNVLTVWTTEDVGDRVRRSRRSWTPGAKSGTKVKLVAVAEDQLATVLASAAASNDLPDAIGAVSLNGLNQLDTDELLDPEAAKDIVDELGRGHLLAAGAGADQRRTATSSAVPSDGWAQLLYYRTDLFEPAGLAAPDHYDDDRQGRHRR